MIDSIKKYFPLFFVGFILCTFFIIGVYLLIETIIFKQNEVKISAKIVDTKEGYDEEDGYYEIPYVTYEYNERTYNHVLLNGYEGEPSVGMEISILCNSKNPRKIYSTDSNQFFLPVLFIAISGIPIFFIAFLFFNNRRKYDYRRFV